MRTGACPLHATDRLSGQSFAPSPSTSIQFAAAHLSAPPLPLLQNTCQQHLSAPPLPLLQNIFGNPSAPDFMAQVSQVALYFVYLAIAALVAAYFQVRGGEERQWGRGRGRDGPEP